MLTPFPYQGNSNVFSSLIRISGFAEDRMRLDKKKKKMSFFFVLCSTFTIFGFAEDTSVRKNPNKIWFFAHLFVSLQSNSGTLTAFLMAANIFKGLGIALVTPFHADGSIDFDALDRLLDYQLDNGTDFFCILATTGETPCLTTDEKHLIKQFVVKKVAGRVPILMGCGGNNTAAVVEELKQTDWQGVDGVLSVCPYYNKPSQEGLYQHFRAIAQASPLPVVLYNVPGRTGINLRAETTVRLANDCQNIVAIKEASGSLEQVDEIIKMKPERFDVISGDDALTFPMIASGAAGVISVIGNALPKEFSRMIRLEFRGEYEPARKIHHRFTELYKLLFVDGNPAGVKALLHEMGFIENELRLPLVPTRVSTVQKMSEIMKEMKL